jgi:hypothetical protein
MNMRLNYWEEHIDALDILWAPFLLRDDKKREFED